MPAIESARWPARTEARSRTLRRRPAPALPTPPAASADVRIGASRQERARRRVVSLVLLIYGVSIVEGALRKWLLPEFGAWLYFLRDPLLLLAYAIATRHRLWPRGQPLLWAGLVMAAGGVLLVLLQSATGGFSDLRLILAIYGWRNYFLYLPLAFLVGALFDRADLLRLFRTALWLAVPIAVLVALQFYAPIDAPINVGVASDEALQFRGLGQTADRTRPMGPFSSGAGQQQYVATTFAILLALLVAPQRCWRGTARPRWPLLALGATGLLACIAYSGSRGTLLSCGLALLFAALLGVVARGAALKARALTMTLLFALGAALLLPLALRDGVAALTERWQEAHRIESRAFDAGIFGRALHGLVDFIPLIEQVPLLGYGLGFGGNASTTLRAQVDGIRPGSLAETDFTRHMVDLGPVFGIGFIAYRVALAGWLAWLAWRATRRSADPLPWMLLSYVGYTVVFGQLTGQGAINLYGWLFAGLLLAACRLAVPSTARPTLAHDRSPAGRVPLLRRRAPVLP